MMINTDRQQTDPNSGRPMWFLAGLIAITLAMLANAIAVWKYNDDKDRITAPLAELIGTQLADAAAPLVLSNNQLSLQALAQKATQDDAVAHAAFYNVRNELLAQAGRRSMAEQGKQVRREISMQDRLLGYARLSLLPPQPGLIHTGLLNILCTLLTLAGLLMLARSVWQKPVVAAEDQRSSPSLLDKQSKDENYEQLPEPEGEYGIIAVELLQLPLMRKQLSEDTLYEYLTTFEHWLEQVARLYTAEIRVGETGFTLSLKTVELLDERGEQLVARTTCCAYALMKALNIANKQRSANSEPVFEARIGAHVSAPLQSEARLLRELYAQDAHRQAWQACAGKPAGTVSLSHSVVAHPECAELKVSGKDNNGFYELQGLEPVVLSDIDNKVQKIIDDIYRDKSAA